MCNEKKRLSLILSAVLLTSCAAVTILFQKRIPAQDYAWKLAAAESMAACMDAVREYKHELGLSISPEDIHHTGMIGAAWSPITTTSGALEAKRTSANPDMAALMVQLLEEAGVKPGDVIGAGFSGSFPALNLAVLSACRAMDVEVIYIASVGASTYGANQIELTFPHMAHRLAAEGLVDGPPAMTSLGGDMDCGLDMEEDIRRQMLFELEQYQTPVLYEKDFAANVQRRMALYEQLGPIACFIGVGGNMTTSGRNETQLGWGVIDPEYISEVNEDSGLVEHYAAQGTAVIHLLNVKQLVADYGMPYDPETLCPPGKSDIFFETRFPVLPGILGIAGSLALMLWGRKGKEGAV